MRKAEEMTSLGYACRMTAAAIALIGLVWGVVQAVYLLTDGSLLAFGALMLTYIFGGTFFMHRSIFRPKPPHREG